MSTESFLYAAYPNGIHPSGEPCYRLAREITSLARAQYRANITDCSYQRTELGAKMAATRERNREARMREILGPWLEGKPLRFIVNGDPRGHAFKLEANEDPSWKTADLFPELKELPTDWGGYFCFEEK